MLKGLAELYQSLRVLQIVIRVTGSLLVPLHLMACLVKCFQISFILTIRSNSTQIMYLEATFFSPYRLTLSCSSVTSNMCGYVFFLKKENENEKGWGFCQLHRIFFLLVFVPTAMPYGLFHHQMCLMINIYFLYMIATVDKGKFLMAARRFRRGPHTEYIVSLDADDLSQGSNAYMGKLR